MALGLIPPAACPISLTDVILSWQDARREEGAVEGFCSLVAERVGKQYALAFNHARTAIAMLLEELHQMYPEKNEVVVPAYTCYTVAAAIARAGLVMVPVDVETSSLCYQHDALLASIGRNTLAIVVVHPFGYPCDLQRVKEIVGGRKVFVIEDCAQAWDSKYKGNLLGSEGNASVFSFGRGKHLNLGGGGVCCVADEELFFRLRRRLESLPNPSHRVQMKRFVQVVLTAIGQHPYIYAHAVRLPFIGIGETHFEPDFPALQWSEWQARFGLRMLLRWQEMAELRKRNADFWRGWLTAHPELGTIPQTDDTMDVTYLRMPVLCERRADAMEWFRRRSIHAQRMYPASLADIADPRLRTKVYSPVENARFVAKALYTLPVHSLFDARQWHLHHSNTKHVRQEEVECKHLFVIV